MSFIVYTGSNLIIENGLLYVSGSFILTGSTNISPAGSLNTNVAGNLIGSRPGINFITGSGINLSASDNPGQSRVDITLDTGSGVATLIGGLVPTVELGTAAADSTKFLRGDQVWATPSTGGVINSRYASAFASGGSGTSGSPWTGWDSNSSGVFANLPSITNNPVTVIFEPGWFRATTGTVNISHSNITVAGFGPQSIIKFNDYGDGLAWYGASASSGSNGAGFSQIVVTGLHLIGANLADGGTIGGTNETHQMGLRLEQVTDFWVTGCYIELFGNAGNAEAIDEQGDGICCIKACKRGHIIGNRLEKNKISGIFVMGNNGSLNVDANWADDIEIISNISSRNHHTGIHALDNCRNIIISNNVCNYNEGRGILLEDVGENTVNTFGTGARFCTISNNICFRNTGSTNAPLAQGGYGINIFGAQDCIISGNIVRETFGNTGSAGFDAGSGINIQSFLGVLYNIDSSRIIINDNIVENNIGSGIRIDSNSINTGSEMIITDNYIRNNGSAGGFGLEVSTSGTIAFSGSRVVGNKFVNNNSGNISIPAGIVATTIDDNYGYNPTVSSSLNFITRVVTTKSGKPVDSDFINPQDGQVVIDTVGLREYIRIGGNWRTGSAIT